MKPLDLPKAENKPAEKTIEAHVEAPVADEKIHLLMVDPHNPAGTKLY